MNQDIETICQDDLRAISGAYSAATGLALATVSRQFHGNQAFLAAFYRGEVSVTVKKLREIVADFSDEWPRGLRWPKCVVLRRPKMAKGRRSLVEENLR